MNVLKFIGDMATFLAIVFVLTFTGNAIGLFNLEFWGTKKANVERKIFEESKSYVHGTIQNLSRYRLEYKTSKDADHKAALREMILTESVNIDTEKLPYDLKSFIKSL